jgi:hypothetical protein
MSVVTTTTEYKQSLNGPQLDNVKGPLSAPLSNLQSITNVQCPVSEHINLSDVVIGSFSYPDFFFFFFSFGFSHGVPHAN